MKSIFRFSALLLLALSVLLMGGSAALAEETVPCYWQLEEIKTDTSLSDRYGPASAGTDVVPVSDLSAAAMTEAVRGARTLSLDVTRATGGYNAHADYTFSGMPALVPGAASARLTITAATRAQERSFYLYAAVFVNSRRVLRVRDTGAWVQRVQFPRKAVPGDTRRVELVAKETHGLAQVHVTYVYRAHAGMMLIDSNGDVVLYDADGREIDRIPQTVNDILPVFASVIAQDSRTIFSAEEQADGSLISRFDPHSGLTEDELIRLLRAASQTPQAGEPAQAVESPESAAVPPSDGSAAPSASPAQPDADVSASATSISTLSPDQEAATLYIAPHTSLSDDVLRALLRAAQGDAVDIESLSKAVDAGEVSLTAEDTPTPAPLSYAELKAMIASPSALPSPASPDAPSAAEESETASPAAEASARPDAASPEDPAQALVIYGDSGVQAIALTPGAPTDGKALLALIDRLEQLLPFLSPSADEQSEGAVISDGLDIAPQEEGSASVSISSIGDSTLLSILPGNVDALIASLDAALVELRATPTPSPTPTPTPEPTATPSPAPTATPSPAPTATPSPEPTATPSPEPTATPSPAPTATPSPAPTATPSPAPTATPSPEPTATPSPEPTATPSPEPTATPSPEPTATPSPAPTATPSPEPTPEPAANSAVMSGLLLLSVLLIVVIAVLLIQVVRKSRKKD